MTKDLNPKMSRNATAQGVPANDPSAARRIIKCQRRRNHGVRDLH
jgi:hypothetical protein